MDVEKVLAPSPWDETNQHWVPRFLLKGFGIKGKASQVYVLDKQTKKIEIRAVESIASKRRLSTEADNQLLTQLEAKASPVVEKLRKGRLDIGPEDRMALDRLVQAIMVNDPYVGAAQAGVREKTAKTTAQRFVEVLARHGQPVKAQHFENLVYRLLPPNYLQIAINNQTSLVPWALKLMGLKLHRTDREFLVIGDSPALVTRRVVDGNRSLLNPGSQVIVPIHSKCLLVYSWDTPVNLIQQGKAFGRELVRFVGRSYYHQSASQYMFGRQDGILIQAQEPFVQRGSPEYPGGINDGWQMMQAIKDTIDRLRAIADTTDQLDIEAATARLASQIQFAALSKLWLP